MDTYLVNVRWGGLYTPYQPLLKKNRRGEGTKFWKSTDCLKVSLFENRCQRMKSPFILANAILEYRILD